MGVSSSKRAKKNKVRKTKSETALNSPHSDDHVRVVSQNAYDEEEVRKLRKELKDTPQLFVLNNLLMSIMFLENHEREKQKVIHSMRTPMEKELNPILLKNERTEFITPDVIFEKVNKNVKFRPLHGPSKHSSEPLIPKRLYVVNDNIEVIESMDEGQYSAIDKPSYQACMEESERQGYVKLRHLEAKKPEVDEKGDEKSDTRRLSLPGTSRTSESSNSIYDYTTITDVKTPKPLDIVSCQRRDTLPKFCFTTRKIKKFEDQSSDSDSDEEPETPSNDNEEDLYEIISYISSRGFMTYFQSAVFPNSLGRALGFDSYEISLAQAIPGKIFCNLLDDDSNLLPCEIYPSVAIQWPSKQTYQFLLRGDRPTLIDKAGDRYRWPTDHMLGEIVHFKCVLLPKGFFLKRGENVDSEIEWEIHFPRAERYLDSRMSHAQLRAMLYLLTIYKSYIEPVTKQHGLLVEHIRHHMYWECEANPRDWPELRLGTKVVKLIESLNEKLAKGNLPDFFIKQKNLFENIPHKYLKHAQKVLHNVLESPIVFFMGALRNLRYTSGKFYPPPNFKKLYTILITEGIQIVNKDLVDESSRPPNFRQRKPSTKIEGDMNHKKEVTWKHKKERINREKILKKRREEKEKDENLNNQRKSSVDSIDFNWVCEKEFDVFKRRELLSFFIKHFIEIARKSRKLSTERQSLLYLKQAYYLTKILEETPGLRADAQDYLDIIAREEEASQKMAASGSFVDHMPPSTPQRNSAQFTFDVTQQLKTNNINLNNLNKKFNSGMTSTTTNFNKLKKLPGNLRSRSSVVRNSSIEVTGRKSVNFSDSIEMR